MAHWTVVIITAVIVLDLRHVYVSPAFIPLGRYHQETRDRHAPLKHITREIALVVSISYLPHTVPERRYHLCHVREGTIKDILQYRIHQGVYLLQDSQLLQRSAIFINKGGLMLYR